MKKFLFTLVVTGLFMAGNGWANIVTLQFNPMDIFQYATTDEIVANQQGTARLIKTYKWENGNRVFKSAYKTYSNDIYGLGGVRDIGAVANILDWEGATVGYQGLSQIDIWLWGVQTYEVAMIPATALSASVNGEPGWDTYNQPYGGGLFDTIYNTVLGASSPWYALSPVFQPAQKLWSVTGDFSVGGADLVSEQQYTMRFSAVINNWPDGSGFDVSGNPLGWCDQAEVYGTIRGTVVPEPTTMLLLGLGLVGLAGIGRKLKW